MTEQIPVAHAVTDPLAGVRKQQGLARICVAAQGAIDTNKSVSEVLTKLARVRALVGGDGEASHAFGQW
jgi:hypothetical protein